MIGTRGERTRIIRRTEETRICDQEMEEGTPIHHKTRPHGKPQQLYRLTDGRR